jgi:osmotically-inducible protein OsmY
MRFEISIPRRAGLAALLAALLAAGQLSACAPLLVGAAVGGAMMATDRRSAGAQVDDQVIEGKTANAVDKLLVERAHVNATSYNRLVLLTGEVPTEADRVAVEKAVAQIETVRSIVNDLAVMPNSSYTDRSTDSLITGEVKADFVGASDLSTNSIKVVTERSQVYLMGLVTETEAKRAVEIARSVGGVRKVVRVFQIVTPAEVAAIEATSSASPASAPAAKQ